MKVMMKPTRKPGPLQRGVGIILSVLCLAMTIDHEAFAKGKAAPQWLFDEPSDVLTLGSPLTEISGLVYAGDGHLIALNDEIARSFFLGAEDGHIRDVFEFKRRGRSYIGDFEGVTKIGTAIWLVNSRGFLLKSVPGSDEVATYNTGLEGICEVEGLASWPQKNALLIACKKTYVDDYGDFDLFNNAVVFQWSLKTHALEPRPFTINYKKLKKKFSLKTFSPSGVTVSRDGKQIIVLSSKEKAVVVLSQKGKLLHGQRLRRKYHPQPEGIALLPDGSMVIADEGKKGPATLTLYRRAKTR